MINEIASKMSHTYSSKNHPTKIQEILTAIEETNKILVEIQQQIGIAFGMRNAEEKEKKTRGKIVLGFEAP
mgnify:CR=1 FL=1